MPYKGSSAKQSIISLPHSLLDSRLDVILASSLKVSRSIAQSLIPQGVYVNGEVCKASCLVSEGDIVTYDNELLKKLVEERNFNVSGEMSIISQKGDLDIVFEDSNYLVINKPAGLLVHPGKGHRRDTLANYLRYYLEKNGCYDAALDRAGIVHRLDRPVSGLMIVAKTLAMQEYLSLQFKKRRVKKYYFASVEKSDKYSSDARLRLGEWNRVVGYLKRDPICKLRRKFSLLSLPGTKKSITNIYPLSQSEFLINIETGRNHQIRATLRHLGYFVRGDALYHLNRCRPVEKIDLISIYIGLYEVDGKFIHFENQSTIRCHSIDTKLFLQNTTL